MVISNGLFTLAKFVGKNISDIAFLTYLGHLVCSDTIKIILSVAKASMGHDIALTNFAKVNQP